VVQGLQQSLPSAQGRYTLSWFSATLGLTWLSLCHLTVCHDGGLRPPFHSFSHPQLSSPLLLFSSLVKHILCLLAPGPKSLLLLALASFLSIFQVQTSLDTLLQLPHHLLCFPVFKVSLTFRQVEHSVPGVKAGSGAC
jgi:hypothetical protein